MPAVGPDALREKQAGGQKTGVVTLRDFDRGVVETLRAEIIEDNYFLVMADVAPPPGKPGIPITFAYPEDVYEKWKLPCLVVSRDDMSPAMNRYHPGSMQYNAPASGAMPFVVNNVTGFSSMETMAQAVPFDLQYSINILSTGRGSPGARAQAEKMLFHVLRTYPPYGAVYVRDSLGDARTYSCFTDAVSMLDEVADISDRTIGFAVTLRVEAECDLAEPEIHSVVKSRAIRYTTK